MFLVTLSKFMVSSQLQKLDQCLVFLLSSVCLACCPHPPDPSSTYYQIHFSSVHSPPCTERETYRWPVKESLRSMLALGWNMERTKEGEAMLIRKQSKISESTQDNDNEFIPEPPLDLNNITLSRELQGMVEVVAENYHNIWAKKKKAELSSKGE
ncbi:unnamed protein product [Oncorhynchus mykiss]|uniref:Ryanodine receptor Ryr domain-containing protein n=1 Tax=Oncorhynchus mykiss TaxID=8022 RepID=A0A060YDJ3_ONCMY|nr:unnamed protein product [Oncorhynchus mykiss]